MAYDQHKRPFAISALKMIKLWRQELDQENPELTNQDQVNFTPLHNGIKNWATKPFSEEELAIMDRIQVSIHSFAQYNTLKKLGLMVIAYKSTASEIGWLREHFNHFDLLQNGEISLIEFTDALKENYAFEKEEIYALFVGMDIDGTGSVHYTEFLAATLEAHRDIDEAQIADAFDRIDSDDSGYITIQNCTYLSSTPLA